MEMIKEDVKMSLQELSKEELENTFGGAWWEVRIMNGELYFIFHYFDDDY